MGVSTTYSPRLAIVSRWHGKGTINEAILNLKPEELDALRPAWVCSKRTTTSTDIDFPSLQITQISQGLAFLHSRDVVHRDFRGANILVDDHMHARITGLGQATLSVDSSTQTNGNHSGPIPFAWAAPELLDDESHSNFACDVYSFGVTCVEVRDGLNRGEHSYLRSKQIYSGKKPFEGLSNFQIISKVAKKHRPARPQPRESENSMSRSQFMSNDLWALVEACWQQDPEKRPNMPSVTRTIDKMIASGTMPSPDLLEQELLSRLSLLPRDQFLLGDIVYDVYKLYSSRQDIKDILAQFTSGELDGRRVIEDIAEALQTVQQSQAYFRYDADVVLL